MPPIDTETLTALEGLSVNPETASAVIVRQLDRKLYVKVNAVLEAAGGKWSRSAKAHVFAEDPREVIEQILLTGEYRNEKQDFGVFYTPPGLAAEAADALEIEPGMFVLEPSAGMGALAKAARERGGHVVCLDVLEKHVDCLIWNRFTAQQKDFLTAEPEEYPRFDRVLMNPPFAKQADAQHVLHALKFLKPGGKLVAIMSAGVTFRETDWYRRVRGLACEIRPLPPNSFKDSGTSVNAVLVKIAKL
jgi:predicted RNA methylase